MPTLSIIIPVYNVSKYIGRCLQSVFMQQCGEEAVECILVNDCTPDDSMDIAQRMVEAYDGNIRFVTVSHDVNSGLSAARNTGIAKATGEFVLFLDSDDQLPEGALQALLGTLGSDEASDTDIVLGNTFLCKSNTPAMNFPGKEPFYVGNGDEEALRQLLTRRFYHIACNKLVRRSLLSSDALFERGIVDEDMLWSYLIFRKARRVAVVPQVTYIYEDNPNSIMNTSTEHAARRIRSRITICERLLVAPPRQSWREYYMYVFYVLTLAIDVAERNSGVPQQLKDELFGLRDRFLSLVRSKGYTAEYLFFLTSRKPFYHINKIRLFRRYYDRITHLVLAMSKR